MELISIYDIIRTTALHFYIKLQHNQPRILQCTRMNEQYSSICRGYCHRFSKKNQFRQASHLKDYLHLHITTLLPQRQPTDLQQKHRSGDVAIFSI